MSASPPYGGGINRQAVVLNKKSSRAGTARPRYRACLVCSYVQASPDWLNYGCPNCEELLQVSYSLLEQDLAWQLFIFVCYDSSLLARRKGSNGALRYNLMELLL